MAAMEMLFNIVENGDGVHQRDEVNEGLVGRGGRLGLLFSRCV